ncbi:hypothetical protein [Salipaludibacillus aurantiacus]|uniref:hypothetical protein n=1 Tax=Salipaludibacillus aurantiacus TaxID=1601833 RepID=UPI000B895DC8|nr:hypothetical protein [Salipaludibacillus aurantiacus]
MKRCELGKRKKEGRTNAQRRGRTLTKEKKRLIYPKDGGLLLKLRKNSPKIALPRSNELIAARFFSLMLKGLSPVCDKLKSTQFTDIFSGKKSGGSGEKLIFRCDRRIKRLPLG